MKLRVGVRKLGLSFLCACGSLE